MTTPAVGAGGAPVGPSGGAAVPGAAVVRQVTPVRVAADPLRPDLSRAGVDLPALLDHGADALVARREPGSAALGELLERARGALVRGAPMEVLAALDAGWDGAARTESGWYFRAAALTLLGLPGEAERVLQQANTVRERSPALAFLLSVVRSAAGDSAGARAALADARAQRPGEPLLQVWDAVLTARAGHTGGALAQLTDVVASGSHDPVMAWARQAIQHASANAQRAARVANPAAAAFGNSAFATTAFATSAGATPEVHGSPHPPAMDVDSLSRPTALLDPVDSALRRLGARLGSTSPAELEADVRQFMQSLSASGAWQEAGRSERSHAVRAVLATLQHVLGRTASDAGASTVEPGAAGGGRERSGPHLGSALDAYADAEGSWRLTPVGVRGVALDAHSSPSTADPTLRRAVLEALRAGRAGEAQQLIGHARAREGGAVVRVLERLVEGAAGIDRAVVGRPDLESAPGTPLSTARDDTLLAPLRFGLGLLQELSPSREARGVRGASTPDDARAPVSAVRRDGAHAGPRGEQARIGRRLRRFVGAGCLLLAAMSLLLGNGPVAILMAGGAAWLLLR